MSNKYSIIVIGAGAGGLVVAIGAAKAGKKILLIDKGTWGGDCTNYGCIPSKSLIASAQAAAAIIKSSHYGLHLENAIFNGDGALDRSRGIVAHFLEHEDPTALKEKGVDTLTGTASFLDPHTLKVRLAEGGETTVSGDNIVIATGSHPHIPSIKGLSDVPYLTNETVFDLKTIPASLGVIGGGPIGCELAQAFHRLGSKVTLVQHSDHLLKKEEIEAQQLIEETFAEEGLQLRLGIETQSIERFGNKIKIQLPKETIEVDQLLVAAGRAPSTKSLDLEAIGVETANGAVKVDSYGRTSHLHITAVGDVVGRALFTHVAENEARTILTNLILPWPFRYKIDSSQPIPRVTYTDPEIAAVGMTEKEAVARYGKNKIAVYSVPFSEVDRAITAGRTEGFVKIVTKKWSSRILGATIAAPRAGEMLGQMTTAMRANIPLRKLASMIHPYPTYNLAIRKAADKWLSQTLLPSLKKLIGRA